MQVSTYPENETVLLSARAQLLDDLSEHVLLFLSILFVINDYFVICNYVLVDD